MPLRGPGILTGGKAPLNQTRASDLCPLRWQRKDTMRRPTRPSALQVSAIHGGGGWQSLPERAVFKQGALAAHH